MLPLYSWGTRPVGQAPSKILFYVFQRYGSYQFSALDSALIPSAIFTRWFVMKPGLFVIFDPFLKSGTMEIRTCCLVPRWLKDVQLTNGLDFKWSDFESSLKSLPNVSILDGEDI